MHQWARLTGDFLAQWHLLHEPRANSRGIVVAACGTNLGDGSDLERVEDESVIGNRCPACQGLALLRV